MNYACINIRFHRDCQGRAKNFLLTMSVSIVKLDLDMPLWCTVVKYLEYRSSLRTIDFLKLKTRSRF